MNHSDSDGSPPDDHREPADEFDWSEFAWERYLREQDQAVVDYWRSYVQIGPRADRIDEVARQLGWAPESDMAEDTETDEIQEEFEEDDFEPYTVHRNNVFVATRAIFAGLQALLERFGCDSAKLPADVAIPLAGALHRAEVMAVLGVQALDLSDRALGISQLKRALAELNQAFGRLPAAPATGEPSTPAQEFSLLVLPLLFDLREIFLRVSAECRADLEHPAGEDDEPF